MANLLIVILCLCFLIAFSAGVIAFLRRQVEQGWAYMAVSAVILILVFEAGTSAPEPSLAIF